VLQNILFHLGNFAKRKKMSTVNLTLDKFKSDVFDFENNETWNYKGELPAIIDFYADWCGPCKTIAPILEELSETYNGKLIIYKVNTEIEQELSALFGIRSIPSLLFIPMHKQPMMQAGALPKNALIEVINDELLEK
jgi:thioredoxin